MLKRGFRFLQDVWHSAIVSEAALEEKLERLAGLFSKRYDSLKEKIKSIEDQARERFEAVDKTLAEVLIERRNKETELWDAVKELGVNSENTARVIGEIMTAQGLSFCAREGCLKVWSDLSAEGYETYFTDRFYFEGKPYCPNCLYVEVDEEKKKGNQEKVFAFEKEIAVWFLNHGWFKRQQEADEMLANGMIKSNKEYLKQWQIPYHLEFFTLLPGLMETIEVEKKRRDHLGQK